MEIFRDLNAVHVDEPVVLTIGTFDGLHLGHQDILRQLQKQALILEAKTAVIAFHPRPKAVFVPARFKNDYLTTPDERIDLFAQFGIDVLILIPFTLEFAQTTAYEFMRMLTQKINLIQMCVGHDFALGKNREGNIDRLTELGMEFNYSICEIQPFILDGDVVSSTRVRTHLRAGEIRATARLLGRYPRLTSHVVQGAKRGRTIGFPTANLAVPPERLLPANGVYASFVQIQGEGARYSSATNVGVRPSFGNSDRTVETYILDFNQDIYGQTVTLEFVERLRPERRFDGIEALVAQIQRDSDQARRLLVAEKQA
jgi:riboflavin kinase/FMN adenylyltransferase